MLAYHNQESLRKEVIAEMAAHRKADELLQGYGYWKDGKGCAVGCLVKGSDHSIYESKFGIPEMLARLEDCIFEGLPKEEAQRWPEKFLSTIKAGANLSLVGWKFQFWLQIENQKFAKKQKMPEDVQKAIAMVLPIMKIMAEKGKLTKEEKSAAESAARSAWSAWSAESAAESARSAAESAWSAWSAAWSAESAAESARSAAESAAESAESAAMSAAWSAAESAESAWSAWWKKMAKKLLELIAEAPMEK